MAEYCEHGVDTDRMDCDDCIKRMMHYSSGRNRRYSIYSPTTPVTKAPKESPQPKKDKDKDKLP